MGKQRVKPNYRRRVLRLPDLDHCKLAVLNSLGSPASRRVYEYAIDQFIAWYCSEPSLAFNRRVVVRYRMYLESRGLAANTINQQRAAVRRLAHEAAHPAVSSSRRNHHRCHPRFGSSPPLQTLGFAVGPSAKAIAKSIAQSAVRAARKTMRYSLRYGTSLVGQSFDCRSTHRLFLLAKETSFDQ